MAQQSRIRSRYSDLYFLFEKVNFNKYVAVTVIEDQQRRSYLLTPAGSKEIAERDIGRLPATRKLPDLNYKKIRSRSIVASYFAIISILACLGLSLVTGLLQTRTVLTGSMVPAIKPGDIIFTTKPTYLSPKKGDVVVYTPRRLDGTPVADFAHRIIGGDATSGWIVKGDANPNPDDQRPKINDIVGVVIFTIPFIGKFLTPQMLSLVLLFAFAIWLILDAFRAPE